MNVQRRLEELSTLNAILEILNREANFYEALQASLEKLVTLLSLTTGWVFLQSTKDDGEEALELAAYTGLPASLAKAEAQCLRTGSCTCQGLFLRGELDAGVNIVDCSRLENAKGHKAGLEVHASVPLLTKDGPVGILNLASPGKTVFDTETLEFLSAIGRTLGLAFRRAQLHQQHLREREVIVMLEERARLARDMQGVVIQGLSAANVSLQIAKQSQAKRAFALEQSADLVNLSLSKLREIDEVLHPVNSLLQSLTPKEQQVLGLVSKGLSNKAIARELGVVEKTIKTHVSSLLSKLHFKRRVQIALWAKEQGL